MSFVNDEFSKEECVGFGFVFFFHFFYFRYLVYLIC